MSEEIYENKLNTTEKRHFHFTIGMAFWGLLLLISLALQVISRNVGGFGEWYAIHIYPIAVNVSGRIFSWIPFSVSEMLFFGGIAGVIVWILWLAVSIIHVLKHRITESENASELQEKTETDNTETDNTESGNPEHEDGETECAESGKSIGSKKIFRTGVRIIVRVLIAAFFLYTVNCGVNYQRTPFSEKAGFDMSGARDMELLYLCLDLTLEVNQAASDLEDMYQAADPVMAKPEVTAQYLAEEGRNAMLAVSEEYPDLAGYYPNAKPITNSWFLSYQELTGIYLPFTVEANYNKDMTDCTKPFTVCHELSHLRGFMREDEANFIAYLACRASDDPYFRYCGALNAYTYATNVLFKLNKDIYWQVRDLICERAEKDFEEYRDFWKPFEGTETAKMQEKINDAYLRANSQYDGVKSYGRMVDLLIALKRQEAAEKLNTQNR